MGLPQIGYNAGAGMVYLDFQRGPQNFRATWKTRAHDNLATSGVRERVVEAHDILITFEMRHLRVTDDLDDWTAFMGHALDGGQFDFTPDTSLPDFYHCVSDDEGFELTRTAPGQYAASFRFRVVPDAQAPADPGVVMRRFYGVA